MCIPGNLILWYCYCQWDLLLCMSAGLESVAGQSHTKGNRMPELSKVPGQPSAPQNPAREGPIKRAPLWAVALEGQVYGSYCSGAERVWKARNSRGNTQHAAHTSSGFTEAQHTSKD